MARRRPRVRIERLLGDWEPRLRRAFLDGVYGLRDAAQVDLIARYLEQGDIDNALRAVNIDPVHWLPWDEQRRLAFQAGGQATAAIVPPIIEPGDFRVVWEFDVRNPGAERWLSQRSSTQVTEIVMDQRAAVRQHLTRGIERGVNPRTSALDLVGRINRATGRREGGVLGLTLSQERWVDNYAQELRSGNPLAALERNLRDKRFDRTVRRAVARGEALSEGQIDTMVVAYRNRALRYRAETIARTETLTSLHQAQQEAIQQATQAGIDPENVSYIWRATKDNRTRDSHRAMDGQVRPMGEPFLSGAGNALRYPGDPNAPPEETIQCRCWLEPRVDFLAGIQ